MTRRGETDHTFLDGAPFMQSRRRVQSALPELIREMHEAARADKEAD